VIEHSYAPSGDLGAAKLTLDHEGRRIYACRVIDFWDGKAKRSGAHFDLPSSKRPSGEQGGWEGCRKRVLLRGLFRPSERAKGQCSEVGLRLYGVLRISAIHREFIAGGIDSGVRNPSGWFGGRRRAWHAESQF
jgi:hypothetical protein